MSAPSYKTLRMQCTPARWCSEMRDQWCHVCERLECCDNTSTRASRRHEMQKRRRFCSRNGITIKEDDRRW